MLRRKLRPKSLSALAGGRTARILLFAALFLLSGLAAWLVLAGRERDGEEKRAAAAPPRAAARTELYFHDFVLPQAQDAPPEIYPWRSPTPRWSQEEVERYWIPLREITLDYLSAENDNRMEKLFAEVP